jgi:hypothetical protein
LSRRAKCVAAFISLLPRRKKSVDILTKSEGILTKNTGVLKKNTATIVKSEGVLTKSKGTPTLSAIILLILSKILEAEKDSRKIMDDRIISRGDALILYLRNTTERCRATTERCHAETERFHATM